jgi:threonylcarbamoyladenosine tRNA methylthiotransferase MtaB
MQKSTFYIHTFGCKTNQSESDEISGCLKMLGFEFTELDKCPEFVIINTCTVTGAADKKVRQFIKKVKKTSENSKIIATGCSVVFQGEQLKKAGADFIFTCSEKAGIPEFINEYAKIPDMPPKKPEHAAVGLIHSRAMIKIQEGCEKNCTYCIVPMVRGGYKSEAPLKILNTIHTFTGSGFEEIVLTGTHIGMYDAGLGLYGLLGKILNESFIRRVRLSSIEINEIDGNLINLIKDNHGRIARHLHIPLQSGSNRILKGMNRKYDIDFFRDRVKNICESIPGIALSTDIIVGFPGETDDDFAETLNVVKNLEFSRIHVFRYSKRPQTPAGTMGDQVKSETKNHRSAVLRVLGNEIRNEFLEKNIGNSQYVVCESFEPETGISEGTSENYIKVYFKLTPEEYKIKAARILKVKPVRIYRDGLLGCIN